MLAGHSSLRYADGGRAVTESAVTAAGRPGELPTRSGFLLTRGWRDTAQGVELTFWAASDEGPFRVIMTAQEPVCFIERDQPCSLPPGARRKPLALRLLGRGAVDALYFRQQRDLQALRQTGVPLAESDIKPADRFLMERFVRAGIKVTGTCRLESGVPTFRNPKVQAVDCQPVLRTLAIDIETRGNSQQLYSIAAADMQGENAAVFMVGQQPDERRNGYDLFFQPDEKAVLTTFLQWLQRVDPDILTGWSVVNFDLAFLERKCHSLNLAFDLGRGGEPAAILQPSARGSPRLARIPGRAVLDGIDLLKAGFWSFDSFSLENVARELLGEGKLITPSQDKVAEINRQFQHDKPGLADYNLRDCTLVNDIFSKADLIAFARQRAALTGLAIDRLGGSVAAFDNLYLPRLHRRGFVAPDVARTGDTLASPGGYVLDSAPGLYEHVLVLDFKSLYPSIIRTFFVDPLGLAEPGDDPVPGFLDAQFSRDNHLLPALIETLWAARDEARRADNAPLSQAIKIIMNSFYGVLGSSGCRFHSQQLATSITRRGHDIIMRSRDWIEQQGFRVIYGDTDSLFVLTGQATSDAALPGTTVGFARRSAGHEAVAAADRWHTQTGERLMQGLNAYWRQTLADELRLESRLEVEFETHFTRFLMPTVRGMPTGSKKRYAGLVVGPSGDNQLVVKGLEAARTDWTPLARDIQRELFRRVFLGLPYDEFLRAAVAALKAGDSDAALVYRKRLRRQVNDYQRNVPPHVQAARKLRSPGSWIRYVMTVNGPEPVEALQSRPDYQHYIDRQLAPAADGILQFLGTSFASVTDAQLQMF